MPCYADSCKLARKRSTKSWPRCIASDFPPKEVVFDGQAWLTVATQFGMVRLPRRVCYHVQAGRHVMPGNRVLPPHEGMLITRGLQEWAYLLPQTLPFETVARLLSWQTQEAKVLSSTTVRTLVCTHGQCIR